MGVHRTCGAPDEIKKNTHPKNTTALFTRRYLPVVTAVVDFYSGCAPLNITRMVADSRVGAIVQAFYPQHSGVRSRKSAVKNFGWVFFLISSGSPHVRPMGRTCGEPDEIELTAMGVKLNGSRCRAAPSRTRCWAVASTGRAGAVYRTRGPSPSPAPGTSTTTRCSARAKRSGMYNTCAKHRLVPKVLQNVRQASFSSQGVTARAPRAVEQHPGETMWCFLVQPAPLM